MQQRGESLAMNKKETIEKKLTASFFKVSTITAAAAVLGVIAIIIISSRYSHALRNFGFAQGDIGKAMFEFADIRSSLRAAIGYDNEEAINTVVKQHEENITRFNEYFAKVEETIVSSEGRETYDAIKQELNTYWELDTKIMDLGATTDRAKCVQAQEIALNELAGVYNSIYEKLESLLSVKVNEGNSLSNTLFVVEWILLAIRGMKSRSWNRMPVKWLIILTPSFLISAKCLEKCQVVIIPSAQKSLKNILEISKNCMNPCVV